MHCIEIWIQFTVIHFSVSLYNNALYYIKLDYYNTHVLQVNELNLFFGKIIDHLRPNKTFENYYPQLQNIVEKIIAHTQDFESLLAMVPRVLIIYSYLFIIKQPL